MMKKIAKAVAATAVATALMGTMSVPAFAAGWQKNDTGWWYGTNADNSTWYANSWQWIDDGDNLAHCYYFDANGYILTNTTTPDGYTVNEDGKWVTDTGLVPGGVVQVKYIDPWGNMTTIQQW